MVPRILTVDDSMAVRIMVKNALNKYDVIIDEAENGEQGIERMKENLPDVLVLDVTMPVMTGVEMLKKVKEDATLSAVPVIMLTAEGSRKVVMEIAQLGVKDYIVKPFKEDVLVDRVSKVTELKKKITKEPMPKSLKDPCKVLVIEDKDAMFEQANKVLSQYSTWKTDRKNSADDAIKHLGDNPAHVVLINMNLPDDQAFKAITEISKMEAMKDSILVGISRKNDDEGREKAKKAGCPHFISKPIEEEEMKEKLFTALKLDDSEDCFSNDGEKLILTLTKKCPKRLPDTAKSKFEDAIDEGITEVIYDLRNLDDTSVENVKTILGLVENCTSLSLKSIIMADEAKEADLKSAFQDFEDHEFIRELAVAQSA